MWQRRLPKQLAADLSRRFSAEECGRKDHCVPVGVQRFQDGRVLLQWSPRNAGYVPANIVFERIQGSLSAIICVRIRRRDEHLHVQRRLQWNHGIQDYLLSEVNAYLRKKLFKRLSQQGFARPFGRAPPRSGNREHVSNQVLVQEGKADFHGALLDPNVLDETDRIFSTFNTS
jgi:hypothetical protein